jgi:hypothetical protein
MFDHSRFGAALFFNRSVRPALLYVIWVQTGVSQVGFSPQRFHESGIVRQELSGNLPFAFGCGHHSFERTVQSEGLVALFALLLGLGARHFARASVICALAVVSATFWQFRLNRCYLVLFCGLELGHRTFELLALFRVSPGWQTMRWI